MDPGGVLDGPDELARLFVRDIEEGIDGTAIRAGMIKVVTDAAGITEDVARIMEAAAVAHRETGVAITTHSHPATRNGLAQQQFLRARGVHLERVVIGHSGDTDDLDYLRAILDEGSTIGMDRFGMEHVLPDDRRVRTVLALLRLGYADRMVLSHDAAVFSHVTPPSWRARMAPRWNMETIPRRIIPMLRDGGATDEDHQLLTRCWSSNPRRLRRAVDPRGAGDEGGAPGPTGRDRHRRRARARTRSRRGPDHGRRRGPVRLGPRRLQRDVDAARVPVDPGPRGVRDDRRGRRAGVPSTASARSSWSSRTSPASSVRSAPGPDLVLQSAASRWA